MRVISGIYKGRRLLSPKDDRIRPTTDRIKETLFNILQFRISGARVLDLFSGTGALGIEALSRGASEVIFADNNSNSIKLIKQNLEKIEGNYKVWQLSYIDAIMRCEGKFDIIFLDPPFDSALGERAIELIFEKGLLEKGGIIAFEHPTASALKMPQVCDIIVKTKQMGSVSFDFLELNE